MSVLFQDDFVGNDGAQLSSDWEVVQSDGVVDIQDNKARLRVTEASFNKVFIRTDDSQVGPWADVTVHVEGMDIVAQPADDHRYTLGVRQTGSLIDTLWVIAEGYEVQYRTGDETFRIQYRGSDGSSSDVGSPVPFVITEGDTVDIKAQVDGETIRASIWLSTDPEPTEWMIEETITQLTTAGDVGFLLAIRDLIPEVRINQITVSGIAVSGELAFTGDNAIRFASDETPVEEAVVVAVKKGVEAIPAQGLTDANGETTLTGLDAGTYRTWAEKTDGSGNLQTSQVITREVS